MFIRFGVFNGIIISVFLFINLAIWVIMFKLLQATITRSTIYGLVLSMPIIITRIITVFNSINNKINPTRYLIFSLLINLLLMGPLFFFCNGAQTKHFPYLYLSAIMLVLLQHMDFININ